jgi:hypothetical protein
MTAAKVLLTAGAGILAGAAIAVRRMRDDASTTPTAERWLTVTVNRAPGDLQADKLPTPLHEYGDLVETRISPAPGDRGTELAVRLRERPSQASSSAPSRLAGDDPRQELRRALRDAKALLETGEVVRSDTTPATTRATPGSRLIGLLSRRAEGEGVL